jgi:hypothetical protein
MVNTRPTAKVVLMPRYGYDDSDIAESEDRGYLSHVFIQIGADSFYPVFFFTPMRLGFEMSVRSQSGMSFVAQTGMIIVPRITMEVVREVVRQLNEAGYFDYMIPFTLEQIELSNPMLWPPKI